jgi:hypothetical protein
MAELLNRSFVMADHQMIKRGLFSGCTAIVAILRIEEREAHDGENGPKVVKKRVCFCFFLTFSVLGDNN